MRAVLPPGDHLAVALESPAHMWGGTDVSQFDALVRFSRRVRSVGEEERTLDLRVADLKER